MTGIEDTVQPRGYLVDLNEGRNIPPDYTWVQYGKALISGGYSHTAMYSGKQMNEVLMQSAAMTKMMSLHPVIYQTRMRPTWVPENETSWTPWTDCSEGSYNDVKKFPVINGKFINDELEYQARKLYAQIEPSPGNKVLPQ